MKTFRAITTTVSVAIDDALPLAPLAHAIIERYPVADHSELHYELTPMGVRRNGADIAVSDPRDVVPTFELDFYNEVVARAAPGWLLHAAALEVNGRALVLCGPSGAGKTTLTVALTARGFRLLTEEVVWIGGDGMVRGLPRAIHVPEGSTLLSRISPSWCALSYPIRDPVGATRHHTLVVPPAEVFVLDERPLAAIVRLGHGADWPVYLQESPHAVALQRLWDRSHRHDDSGLEVATSTLRRYPSYALSSTSESEALALLEPLLK